jgi:DNA polymerase
MMEINKYGKREIASYLTSDDRIHVNIDLETYSPIDLKKAGLYNYAQKVEILLFAIHIPGEGTLVFDLTRERLPDRICKILLDPLYLKKAWNAPFEMACIESHFMIELDPDQWFCTMAQAAMSGLPLGLDQCGRVLNLDIRKDVGGMQCIRYFCMPCAPTKTNGGRTRNLPHHNPELWNYFKKYVGRDVDSEMAIGKVVSFLPMPAEEKILWNLDQKINRAGVRIDIQMAKNAIAMDLKYREKVIAEAIKLTGVENPSSVKQIKKWLEVEEDIEIESLNKKHMPALLKKITGEKSKRVLEIRNELSKTSVRKYTTMVLCACEDERVKGIHQIYGAGRTLRFSGRLVQFQNIVKGKYHGTTLKAIRDMIKAGDDEYMEMVFGAVPETLSNLIRTAIIPKEGCEFAVSDFSAIEARVIAWLAREDWRLKVFATHGKIYEASAAQMFKIPIESVTKSSDYRAKSKVAELALGYAGGVNALIKMGAIEMGLESDELQPLVDVWRAANPNIVALWKKFNYAAIRCVKTGLKTEVTKNIYFEMRNNFLLMWLPSGHPLCYYNPGLEETKFGHQVFYWGMDQTTKSWVKIRTYGGKLVENATQGVARDCLVNALLNIDQAGIDISMHVHDEIVAEVPIGKYKIQEINELMTKKSAWMTDLPLAAEGEMLYFYQKA